jgi:RNA polymerase sigma-70 factor (ECF subfamily)
LKPFGNFSDSELAQKIRNSEKAAFQELFERYAPRIYQFSVSYLKNNPDAEELVQEVFLKIWEKRETLDQSKNIKAYIFKIAVNAIYDFIRKKNIEAVFADFARANFERTTDITWHSVIFEEMTTRLTRLIARLPEQQRNVFYLSKDEGLSNDEIAEKLNLSKRTVENHLYRAVSFLKEHFKNDSLGAVLFFYLCCG